MMNRKGFCASLIGFGISLFSGTANAKDKNKRSRKYNYISAILVNNIITRLIHSQVSKNDVERIEVGERNREYLKIAYPDERQGIYIIVYAKDKKHYDSRIDWPKSFKLAPNDIQEVIEECKELFYLGLYQINE